jgi:hypothetical protein
VWPSRWHAVLAALMSTALDQLINRKQTFEGELERIEDRVCTLLYVAVARPLFVCCSWLNLLTQCLSVPVMCRQHVMQLYELETAYLSAEHSQCGTVLKVRIPI